jgi:hypothetical protein
LKTEFRHFSCVRAAFWLRISGILVTLDRAKLYATTWMRAAPVYTCIRPCRKTPVVGGAKLWKNRGQVITAHAAALRERACEPRLWEESATELGGDRQQAAQMQAEHPRSHGLTRFRDDDCPACDRSQVNPEAEPQPDGRQ